MNSFKAQLLALTLSFVMVTVAGHRGLLGRFFHHNQSRDPKSTCLDSDKGDWRPEAVEQANKRLVMSYFQAIFGDLDLSAIDRYVEDPYIQHNPTIADGKEAFRQWATGYLAGQPKKQVDFWHVGADDDLVWVHTGEVNNETAFGGLDLYRVKNCKIVEHWDVLQLAKAPFANSHPMH